MKKILFSTFLLLTISIANVLFIPTNVKADIMPTCNIAIDELKAYGFSFQKYNSSNFTGFSAYGVYMCGSPPNSQNMIMVMGSPLRVFVIDAYSTREGYCVMLNSGQIFKTTSDNC